MKSLKMSRADVDLVVNEAKKMFAGEMDDLRPIRTGEALVLESPRAGYVLRAHPPGSNEAAIRTVISAVSTMSLTTKAPIVSPDPAVYSSPSGWYVTIWPRAQTVDPLSVTPCGLGALIAELHEAVPPTEMAPLGLPPALTTARALAQARIDAAIRAGLPLHSEADAVIAAMDKAADALIKHGGAVCVIHGDAHHANVVRMDKELWFIDLDGLSTGPRALDLGAPAVSSDRYKGIGGWYVDRSGEILDGYNDRCEKDKVTKKGLQAAMAFREAVTSSTGFLMSLADSRHLPELRKRVATLGEDPRVTVWEPWYPKGAAP